MRILVLFIGSWLVGVMIYWLIGSITAGKVMGSGDLGAAALYSGMMFALTAPVSYLPAIWWVRRQTSRSRTAVIMTAVAVIHTFAATAFVFAAFGGFHVRSLLTSEAMLFYIIFGTAGALVCAWTLKA